MEYTVTFKVRVQADGAVNRDNAIRLAIQEMREVMPQAVIEDRYENIDRQVESEGKWLSREC